jgi:hypothetical protein
VFQVTIQRFKRSEGQEKATEFNTINEIILKVHVGHKDTDSIINQTLQSELIIDVVEAYL